jgi:hypothetical protein
MNTVTITMPLDSAANTITVIMRRMHDLQDYREKYPDLPQQDDVMSCYQRALDAMNESVPEEFRQYWVRS